MTNARGEFEIVDGFARVHEAGAGIMLIQRAVFERMAELPGLLVRSHETRFGARHRILQCFRRLDDENGVPIAEDMSFCRRWTEQCGGDVWINVAHEITHVGAFPFKGKLLARLEHLRRSAPA